MTYDLGNYESLYKLDQRHPGQTSGRGSKPDHQPSRILHVKLIDTTERERQRGEHPIIYETSDLDKARVIGGDGRFTDHALQIVHKVSHQGDRQSTELRVHSPILQESLRHILIDCVDANIYESPIVILKPFKPLFHNRQLIWDYASAPERTQEEKEHLEVLTGDFFDKFMQETLRRWETFEEHRRVSFDALWTLFQEEEEVLVRQNDFSEVKRVRSCNVVQIRGQDHFVLSLWSWAYTRGVLGPCLSEIKIPSYHGNRKVDHLDCYPLRFGQDPATVRRRLIERGHEWYSITTQPQHRLYSGPVWITRLENRWESIVKDFNRLPRSSVTGRIMLDADMHVQEFPELAERLQGSRVFPADETEKTHDAQDASSSEATARSSPRLPMCDTDEPSKTPLGQAGCYDLAGYKMTDEQALLSPAHAQGFSFQQRKWAYFLVDHVKPIQYDREAFDQLELPARRKSFIHKLVESCIQREDKSFHDYISGKGKGLVICLEGSPGSGKTLMAESIAELEQRPLYCLSTSDLGPEPGVAEQNLQLTFDRAARWKAILLLDEADLFLTRRTVGDMKRNAFVTVFLRLVEYYPGVLFLTTNRIKDFDPAFESRIHFRATVEPPTADVRRKIWRRFIAGLSDVKGLAGLTEDDLSEVAKLDLNGREIRNLLSMSLSMVGDGSELTCDTILETYKEAFAWKTQQ